MSFLSFFCPGDNILRMGIVVLVQVTVVMLLVLLLTRIFWKRNAAVRESVLLFSVIFLLISPALTVTMHQLDMQLVEIPLAWTSSLQMNNVEPIFEPETVMHTDTTPIAETKATTTSPELVASMESTRTEISTSEPVGVPNRNENIGNARAAVGGGVILLWLSGTFYLLIRLGHGLHTLRRLRRESCPIDDHRLQNTLSEIRTALGIHKLPLITTSHRVPSPVSFGIWRPMIVLPHSLVESLNPKQIRAILVHECAHILRHDPMTSLVDRLTVAFYWLHPLVHYLIRQLVRSREEVCDNYVLKTDDPQSYSQTLLLVSQKCNLVGASVVSTGMILPKWKLEDRVGGLLDNRRRPMTRNHPLLWVVFGGIFCAMGIVCGGLRLVDAGEEQSRGSAIGSSNETKKKSIEAEIAIIKAQIEVAHARVRLKSAEHEETKRLYDLRIESKMKRDASKAVLEEAQGEVKVLEATLHLKEVRASGSENPDDMRENILVAEIAILKANIEVAEARVRRKSSDFEEAKRLFGLRIISQHSLDISKVAYEVAQVEVKVLDSTRFHLQIQKSLLQMKKSAIGNPDDATRKISEAEIEIIKRKIESAQAKVRIKLAEQEETARLVALRIESKHKGDVRRAAYEEAQAEVKVLEATLRLKEIEAGLE